jgi:phosphatidylinositol phospholipase C delta
MSPREAISFINDRSTIKVDANKPEVTYGMFFNVMTYEDNDIIDSSKAVKNHDMTHPLAHYFIASSHNTYLEGDQLTSNSSVNRYIDDLISGCRCVELDCWDGDAGEPIIYHGHTLTSQIFFKDVIVAIKEYGFKSSPYPIILSIEQHCSLEQQARQVEIMKSTFGDMLGMPQEGRSALPSPEDLKYKVLLKGNRNKAIGRDDDDENSDVEEKKKASTDKTHPELSAITFLGTSKVKEFNDSGNSHIPCDSMCSFSETTTLKYLKSETTTENWVKHNNIHMSRIYPMGTRVDSSNYDPVPCWTAGNHLVALNYQTPDRPMQLNRGKFRENGNCGYLLKPSYMLEAGAKSPPIQLTITILSAHQLPRPALSTKIGIIDPFISVAVFNDMEEMQEQRTKTMYNNGFNPLYNETKTFTVKNPDLAILAFQVIDEEEVIRTQSFCAMACLGVSCVKPGLREVKLFDGNGGRNTDFAHATVTVYVQVQPLAG